MKALPAKFGVRSLMAIIAAAALLIWWAKQARDGRPPWNWIKLLERGDVGNRRIAAWQLSEPEDAGEAAESALPLIRAMQEDEDPEVRASSGHALGRLFGRPEAPPPPESLTPALLLALKDPEPVVRAAAAAALGSIKADPDIAVGSLVALANDPDPRPREAAAGALSLIAFDFDVSPAVGGAIARVMARTDPHAHAPTFESRFIKLAEQSPMLAAATMRNGTPQVRREIARILSQPPNFESARKLIPTLFDALQDEDGGVRRDVAATLLQNTDDLAFAIPDSQAVPRLASLLGDTDPRVRQTAALVLSRYRSRAKDALPALAKAAGDPDPDVRIYASRARLAIEAEPKTPAPEPSPPAPTP